MLRLRHLRRLPVLEGLPPPRDLQELVDDQDVEDGESDDGAHAEEGFAHPEVALEYIILRDEKIFIRFPDACFRRVAA